MAGFSHLSEHLSAEQLAKAITAYLEICSSCIVEHGGQVAEYVGDCVIAYFPPDQADAAISSCMDALRGLAESQQKPPLFSESLNGGFGLAVGSLIEGNIGSSVKMNYTILGEALSLAIQLESLSRRCGVPLLLSESVRENSRTPWPFKPLPASAMQQFEGEVRVYSIEATL